MHRFVEFGYIAVGVAKIFGRVVQGGSGRSNIVQFDSFL